MKHCWVWNIKEEHLDEYVKMHREPWQDVLDAHSEAGISNYSIFQNGNQFVYVFECDDVKAAFDFIDKSEACNRWNAITSTMVEGSFDFSKPNPIVFLDEVFYLK